MKKCTIFEHDPFIMQIRDEQETIDLFGEDYLQDESIEIDEDLMERYKRNWAEFKGIQEELRVLKKTKDSQGI